jgi:hypothetical protein
VRLSYAQKVAEVLRVMKERGENPKHLQELLGIDKSQWSRKKRREKNEFSHEEFDKVADHYGAPPGWPHLLWSQAEALEGATRLLEELRQHAPQATAGPVPAPSSGQPKGRKSGGRK